jgi:hypothetical protein
MKRMAAVTLSSTRPTGLLDRASRSRLETFGNLPPRRAEGVAPPVAPRTSARARTASVHPSSARRSNTTKKFGSNRVQFTSRKLVTRVGTRTPWTSHRDRVAEREAHVLGDPLVDRHSGMEGGVRATRVEAARRDLLGRDDGCRGRWTGTRAAAPNPARRRRPGVVSAAICAIVTPLIAAIFIGTIGVRCTTE